MNFKIFLLSVCFGISSIVSGQHSAIDKKATIISGSASIVNQGGGLFETSDGKHATSITFAPAFNHFITNNFFIGGGIYSSSEKQGDYSTSAFGIGPQIGYAFGNSTSKVYPYIDLGIRYYKTKVNVDGYYGLTPIRLTGSEISMGFGIIVPVKYHIGLIFEGEYQKMKLKNKQYSINDSGDILSFRVGIAGLLFKSEN
jgi:hypothetical protein